MFSTCWIVYKRSLRTCTCWTCTHEVADLIPTSGEFCLKSFLILIIFTLYKRENYLLKCKMVHVLLLIFILKSDSLTSFWPEDALVIRGNTGKNSALDGVSSTPTRQFSSFFEDAYGNVRSLTWEQHVYEICGVI